MEKLLLPLTAISGIGAQIAKNFTRLINGERVIDLLLHQPTRAENILFCPEIFSLPNNSLVILQGKIEAHQKPEKSSQPHKFICYNKDGYFSLVFFKIFPSQIAKLKIGNEIAVLGNFQRSNGENQITHPQEILPASEIAKMPKINVIYPLTYQVSQKFLSAKINQVLRKISENESETIDLNLLKKMGWNGFITSLKHLHYFSENKLIILEELQKKARQRLAFDELLAWQIASLTAKNLSKNVKENFAKKDELIEIFLKNLPFALTNAQKNAIATISKEIFSTKKMLRLLQGDVGSGKTLVAICACLASLSQHRQACVIAPTTVLAKQHFKYFSEFLEKFNFKIALLTSDSTKKQKREILENLQNGSLQILIGTHALIEDGVIFQNLGSCVIDEQHRFGVMQRLKLTEKNKNADILLMSATPIPRSLMMSFYGNIDISILDEKPKNRQEIETLIISQNKQEELFEGLKRAVLKGEKIYWVCPAINENEALEDEEKLNLIAATKKFEELKNVFPNANIGLLHGKMKEKDKEKIMQDFAQSALQILVATTVIEVGIDVKDATIMVIENAQNFGLAQLHQLRGRVGRGEKKSFCFLIYSKKISANGRKRLEVLRTSNDGFFIASQDLKMRGAGDLIGTRQSGLPEFKIANFDVDFELMEIALKQAKIILNEDENLVLEKNKKYRQLLEIFGYDDCLKLIKSG
jgi:ATP-dependent DNA helicase RecG